MPGTCITRSLGLFAVMAASLLLAANALAAQDAQQEVMAIEQAFADTMAERDFEAFQSFLSEEAIFFAGETPLRGKQAVSDAWRGYYEGEAAPFSWQPAQVQVLESGGLALSTGPVHNPDGVVVGTFTSIWQQQADGGWRIIFDKGAPVCPPPSSTDG